MQMLSNFWWFSITFGIKSKILGVLYNALHGLPPAQITTPHLLLGHNNHNEPIGLPNPYLHVPFSLSVTYMPPPYARDSVYLSPHLRSFPWFLLHLCLSQAGLGATPLGFSTTWGLAPLLHWPYLFSRFVCLSYQTVSQLRSRMGSPCSAQWLAQSGAHKMLAKQMHKT